MTQTESAQTVERSVERKQSAGRRFAFLAPIILVNALALGGQSAWAYGEGRHSALADAVSVSVIAVGSILLGITLESIGVYLMLQAHDATMADQSSGFLRLSAYGVAGIMAALNWDHWNRIAWGFGVMFALLSMVSPFLWSVRSKSMHRAQQAARGIVDPAGVKLSTGRKLWHPLRSLGVLRWASWAGETDPSRAVSGWERAVSIQSTPLQGEIVIETGDDVPEIETVESDTDTETVVETVTETKTVERRHSVSREQKRERVMRERVAAVQRQHLDWESVPVTYAQIKSATGLTGVETVKGIYHALYPERVRAEISD